VRRVQGCQELASLVHSRGSAVSNASSMVRLDSDRRCTYTPRGVARPPNGDFAPAGPSCSLAAQRSRLIRKSLNNSTIMGVARRMAVVDVDRRGAYTRAMGAARRGLLLDTRGSYECAAWLLGRGVEGIGATDGRGKPSGRFEPGERSLAALSE
jgi:hypothetical protein